MGVQEFIEIVSRQALKLWEEGSHIYPSVRIAQCCHETGAKFTAWNNLVGFKATGAPNEWWDGSYVVKGTWEVVSGVRVDMPDAFRAYPDIEHCLRDHERLMQADRYRQVREARTPEDQAVALYRCGYATDPEYHKKLILNWILPLNLKMFDTPQGVVKKGARTLEFKNDWQWSMLGDALDVLYKASVAGVIEPAFTDYTWAEKAYKREMTVDELAWLNTIIMSRVMVKGDKHE